MATIYQFPSGRVLEPEPQQKPKLIELIERQEESLAATLLNIVRFQGGMRDGKSE